MKAIILAAGKGSRLKKFTENRPKCLLEVNNKPILAYQLEALMANDIKSIVMVVGYKSFMIKDFIKNHPVFKDLSIVYIENDEYANSNSSYSCWLARDQIKNEEGLIYLNADLIFFDELIDRILNSKYKNVVYIDKKIKLNDSMEQVILSGDKMVEMDKSNIPGAHGKAVGVAKFSNEAIQFLLQKLEEYIGKGDKNQHFYGMIRWAVKVLDFHGLDVGSSLFREVNTTEDYEIARKDAFGEGGDILKRSIIMLYGHPATGKTTVSRKIRDYFEREINVDLLSTFRIREELGLVDLYSSEQREKVYNELANILREKLKKNISKCIILDGNFNKKERRKRVYELAKEHGCDIYIVQSLVDDVLDIKERMEERKLHKGILEHKASTIDLYEMIKKTTDTLEEDDFFDEEPIIITSNTRKEEAKVNKDVLNLEKPKQIMVNGILGALRG